MVLEAPSTIDAGTPDSSTPVDLAREAAAAVHVGLWVSAIRCVLTYVVAPLLGGLGLVLGPVGLLLQILGAITATTGAGRLRRLRHRAWAAYAIVALTVDVLTAVSLGQWALAVLR
jgi:hypothetical protein